MSLLLLKNKTFKNQNASICAGVTKIIKKLTINIFFCSTGRIGGAITAIQTL